MVLWHIDTLSFYFQEYESKDKRRPADKEHCGRTRADRRKRRGRLIENGDAERHSRKHNKGHAGGRLHG